MPRLPAAPALTALCLVLPVALAACGDRTLGERLGMGKRAPDEFAVVKRAPLIMPPDYNLRPPRPGESRPQELAAGEGARAVLTGQPAAAASAVTPAPTGEVAVGSPGQQALLQEAGATAADPRIRERVAAEANEQTGETVGRTLFGRLFGWGGEPPPPGQVVDAAAEAERLRAAEAAGLPPTESETPMVVRRASRTQPTFETLGGQTTLGTADERVN